MEVSVQKQNILRQPLGITLVALGAAVVWVAIPGDPGFLALIAVAVLFIMGLKKPIWAVASLLVSQLVVPNYMIGMVSLRLLLVILIGIVLWRAHIREKINLGEKAKLVLIPFTILTVVITLSNLINSSFDFVFKDFRYWFSGLFIVIFLPAVVKNVRDLKLLSGVAIIVMTISTIIALEQTLIGSGRVWGISKGALELSYLICVVFLASLGMLFAGGRRGENRGLLIPAVLMLPALYLTNTRSALVALVFGLGALFLFLKTRIRSEIILLVVLGITLYLSISGVTESYFLSGARSESEQKSSGLARQVLWQAGLAIAKDNPVLGIGGDQFLLVSQEYAFAVDPSLAGDRYQSNRLTELGRFQIHNDFLRMWVYYGIIAMLVFIWIIVAILRSSLHSFHISKQKFIRGLSLGLAAGLISYCVNSFFHNALTTFSLFWLIAGFALAVNKLSLQGSKTRTLNGNLEADNA